MRLSRIHLQTRLWPAIEICLDEISYASSILTVLSSGDEVIHVEYEVFLPWRKRLVVPHVVEQPQVVALWCLAECADLSITQ